jgi:hypothetical protein
MWRHIASQTYRSFLVPCTGCYWLCAGCRGFKPTLLVIETVHICLSRAAICVNPASLVTKNQNNFQNLQPFRISFTPAHTCVTRLKTGKNMAVYSYFEAIQKIAEVYLIFHTDCLVFLVCKRCAYLHKRPKHILLLSHTLLLQCFFPFVPFFHCCTSHHLTR